MSLPMLTGLWRNDPNSRGARLRMLRQAIRAGCRRYPLPAVYAAVAVTAAVVSQTWFSPGRFNAGGDVGLFLRSSAANEFGWLWSHQTSGAGSASTEIARAFEVAVSTAVTAAGFSDLVAQRVLYALLLACAAVGTAWVAGAFTRRAGIVALSGLLGVANPLLLIASFNPVLIAPIGVLGGLTGCVLRAAQGRWVPPAAVGALSVTTSYLALNPPTLAVTVLAVIGVALLGRHLVGPGATARSVMLLIRSAPWVLVFNLWWMVPVAAALISRRGDVAAITDVTAWTWSHANNTVWDVAALNAHWTWTHHEYLPAAAALDQPWWSWLRYLLPTVALLTPLVALPQHRRRSIVTALCALTLVFVGKGVHEPLGGVNVWMYDHVPGFWLLREPLNKVGPALLLCYVLLIVVWLESAPARLRRRSRRLLGGLPFLAVILMLIYPWPVYTGAVVPTDRAPLPSARVALPAEWRSVADTINAQGGTGKAVVLPLNSYYQVDTSWGYHGVDSLLPSLLDRPVLQRLPGGYFNDDDQYEQLLIGVEQSLAGDRPDDAARLLRALGVSHLIVRHDLVPDNSAQAITTDALSDAAKTVSALAVAVETSIADVFTVHPPHDESVAIYSSLVTGFGHDPSTLVSALPASAALADAPTANVTNGAAAALAIDTGPDRTLFTVPEHAKYQVKVDGSSWWRVAHHGDQVTLWPQDSVAVDGMILARRRPVTVDIGSDGIAAIEANRQILRDGDLIALEDGARIDGLARHDHMTPQPSRDVGDCNTVDDRSRDETRVGGNVTGGTVRLRAAAHAACVRTLLLETGSSHIELQLDMRSLDGAAARACVWQIGPNTCAPVELTAETSEWTTRRAIVHPTPGTTALELYVYADGLDNGTTTRTEYRDITVTSYEHRDSARVHAPPARHATLDAGTHELAVERPESTNLLGEVSELRSCGDGTVTADLGADPIANGIRLRATDHVACVIAPIHTTSDTDRYVLQLKYRSVAGHPPRVCVWQVGPDTCAATPQLDRADGWQPLRTTVRPDPDAEALELYLYADGFGDDVTVTEYRDLRVTPAIPQRAAIQPADAAAPPTMLASRVHPARYDVEVGGATNDLVLGLAESHDDGWTLTGLPDGWSATHLPLDGYANGWALRRTSPDAPHRLHVKLEHRPSLFARPLLWLPAAAGIILWQSHSRRRRHERTRRHGHHARPANGL